MNIMSSREVLLRMTGKLWDSVDYPLLALTEDGGMVLAEQWPPDDLGFYYFVSLITRTFSLSLEAALWWFDFGLMATGFLKVGCAW